MVETLFPGTLSLELQVGSGFLTHSGERMNELHTVIIGLHTMQLGY